MNVSVSKKETAGLIVKALIVIIVLLLFSILKTAISTTYNAKASSLEGKLFYTEELTEIYVFDDSSSGKYSILDYDKGTKEITTKEMYLFDYMINAEDNNITVTFFRTEDNSRTLTFIKQGLLDIDNNKYFIELVD